MSHGARMWALSCALSGPTKAVLLALAIRADDDDKCWPAVGTIAHDAGVSERSAQGSLRALERAGLVVSEGVGGRRLTRMYRLQVGTEAPPETVHVKRETVHVAPERVQDSAQKGAYPAPEPTSEPIIEPEIKLPPTNPPPPAVSPKPATWGLFGDQIAAQASKPPILVNGKAVAFEEFWQAFPKRLSSGRMVRDGKQEAMKAYAKAIKITPPDRILDAVLNYPFELDRPQFIPEPAKWLAKGKHLADVSDAERTLTLGELDAYREQQRMIGTDHG